MGLITVFRLLHHFFWNGWKHQWFYDDLDFIEGDYRVCHECGDRIKK